MKKLLGIMVLGLLWCNVCFSVTTEPLKIKSGEENHIYNIWIIDYNDFKKDFNSEVIRFCANQTIAGGGIQQLMDQTKCKYRAAVDLATKYNIDTNEDLFQRSTIMKRAEPLKVECIVRGYITGSGWKEYQAKGSVSGIELESGLQN